MRSVTPNSDVNSMLSFYEGAGLFVIKLQGPNQTVQVLKSVNVRGLLDNKDKSHFAGGSLEVQRRSFTHDSAGKSPKASTTAEGGLSAEPGAKKLADPARSHRDLIHPKLMIMVDV